MQLTAEYDHVKMCELYLSFELTKAEEQDFEHHVATCQPCQKMLQKAPESKG